MKITCNWIILFYVILFFWVHEDLLFAKRLFVLHPEAGILTEYDPSGLTPEHQITIPGYKGYQRYRAPAYRFRPSTQDVLVNASGHILYYEDRVKHDPINGRKLNVRTISYWNGKKWRHAEVSYPEGIDLISVPFLDEKENVFYWYVNTGIETYVRSDANFPALYVNNDFELYRFYFRDQLVQERIIKIGFDECFCGTGVCEETCPVGRITTANGIIQPILSVQHFISGQLGSEIRGTTYYVQHGNQWVEKSKAELQHERFLKIIEDAGCCGWVNESNDQLIVDDGRENFIIYDEYRHFDNQNYDISFYIFNADFSLDRQKVAYTIRPCCKPFDTIRFSSDTFDKSQGREYIDSEDRKKIKQVLDTLPLVEVSTIQAPPKIKATIRNAILSGWMDNDRLVLVKDRKLAIFSLLNKTIQTSLIQVESIHQVYLR